MKAPKLISGLMMAMLFSLQSFAGGGEVSGRVMYADNSGPVPNARVVFSCQGNELTFIANENGFYYATNLPPCTYKVSVGLSGKLTVLKDEVVVKADAPQELAIAYNDAIELKDVEVTAKFSEKSVLGGPIIGSGGVILDHHDFEHTTVTKVDEIPIPGVVEIDGKNYFHGAREGSSTYYIDNCKVMGSPNIPLCGLDYYRAYVGYIPAKYGDCTGGVIAMETRSFFSN